MGVGAQLRRAREARGLTVRDVADTTKISSRQIDAIESEHYEKLPGGIFGRGYVRAVAAALKLDADAFVEAYRDETEPERSAVQPPPSGPGADAAPRRAQAPQQVSMAWRLEQSEPRMRMATADLAPSRSGSRWLAAVLIGVGAILLIFWLGREQFPAPVSGVGPASAPRPSDRAVTARAGSAVPRTPAHAGGAPAVPDRPVGTVGETRGDLAPVRQPAADAAATSAPPDPPPDARPVDLLIVAERPSWMVLIVDGERIARRTLQPRESVRARLRERATLMTGDAGALRVSVAGGELRPVGPAGAVRTIEITPPDR